MVSGGVGGDGYDRVGGEVCRVKSNDDFEMRHMTFEKEIRGC